MSNSESISELVNAISQETLGQEVIMLKRRIQRSEIPFFIMGYCAADSSTFEQVARYIQEQLTPQATQQPMEITLEPNQRNLEIIFCNIKKKCSLRQELLF